MQIKDAMVAAADTKKKRPLSCYFRAYDKER